MAIDTGSEQYIIGLKFSANEDDKLSKSSAEILARLMQLLVSNELEFSLPVVDEIKAITAIGVDPELQVQRLGEILDRWTTQH